MDTNRFDAWSKALAGRASRRTAVGRLAGGGGVALLGAVGLGRSRAAAQEDVGFNGDFIATIYQGPNKDLSIRGSLQLVEDDAGRLTGELVPETGEAVPVTGQLNGDAINLVFYLPEGKLIFGVGTLGQRPGTDEWVAGGPLVGPDPGDSGDWDICLRCSVIVPKGNLVCVEIICRGVT